MVERFSELLASSSGPAQEISVRAQISGSRRDNHSPREFIRVVSGSYESKSLVSCNRRQFFWAFGVVALGKHFLWNVID
jgi:uncharacterized MAPEG superfamily protein